MRDRDPQRQDVAAVRETYRLALYPALFDRVVCSRQPLVFYELAQETRLTDSERAFLQRGDTVSLVAVPMVSGERVLGYFVLNDRQAYLVSDSELDLYRGIANQSATAFSNALLLSEMQGTLDNVNVLYDSSRAIATATTQEDLNDIIIRRIAPTNIDRCEILFYGQGEDKSRFVEVIGSWIEQDGASAPGTRYDLGTYPMADIAYRLSNEGTFIIDETNVADQSPQVLAFLAGRGIKALALVPMKVGDEYIGFLSIERHKTASFSADSVRFYETIATQSAVALRNIQLIAQSQEQLRELQQSYDDVSRLVDTVRQLSSPVIQVWEDVLVLPLIGAIDSRRALRIMEDLLTGITHYQAEQVIIDITGVLVMDTSVVNYLLKTISAASLLGARCMLVGINSEMAQTIVSLGLDLSSIATYSNLRAGIQAALQSTGHAITSLSPDGGEEIL